MKPLHVVLLGLGLAAVRFLYTFFPLSPITDLAVFFAAAFLVFRFRPGPPWLALLLAAPTVVLLLVFVAFVGRHLAAGVGAYNLIGVFVVPAASLGGWFAASSRSRVKS